jgi:hypothetical protein
MVSAGPWSDLGEPNRELVMGTRADQSLTGVADLLYDHLAAAA